MKNIFFGTLCILHTFSISASVSDLFPKGNTLTFKNILCQKNQTYKCLSARVDEYGTLVKIPKDKYDSIKLEASGDQDLKISVGNQEFLTYVKLGDLKILRKELKSILAEAKSNSLNIYIPKIKENSGFLPSSAASGYFLPIFIGPSLAEIEKDRIFYNLETSIESNNQEIKKLNLELTFEVNSLKRQNSDLSDRIDHLELLIRNMKNTKKTP